MIYHLNTKSDLHTDEIQALRIAHGAELKTVSADAAEIELTPDELAALDAS